MEIKFYTTKKTSNKELLIKLVEKILSDSQSVTISITDKKHADEYDKLLWEFDENSFIPHSFDTDKNANKVPVLISQDITKTEQKSDVLMFIDKNFPETEDEISALKNYKKVIFITDGNDREELMLSEELRTNHLKTSDFEISIHTQTDTGKWG